MDGKLKKKSDKDSFGEWVDKWKSEIKFYYKSIIFSIFLLVLATVINYSAGVYVTNRGSAAVSDLILDNIGPYDLSFLFVYGWFFLVGLLIIYPVFFKVGLFHRVLGQFSFLIILRSFFIILTHLKTPLDAIYGNFPEAINVLVFQNDLFFSGHVAVSFLGFLMYKGHKIRWLFLTGSILMAATVLLMHQHYSIDVFAAYFIAYGSYHIARFFSPFNEK